MWEWEECLSRYCIVGTITHFIIGYYCYFNMLQTHFKLVCSLLSVSVTSVVSM